MDGRDFDALTRALATRKSRRGALRSGLALAAALGLRLTDEAAAAGRRRPGQVCRSDGECASGLCGPPDRTGRRRCACSGPADCPRPSGRCKIATCNAGVCGVADNAGGSCDTGVPCTANGVCDAGGKCIGTPVTCMALDQCHEPGVCDQRTGRCTNLPKPDGTACDDGNGCTRNDTCQAGVCTRGNPVVCTALNQCHAVGTCDPATGRCSNPNLPDGTACDDGNACTSSDTCQAGTCVGGDSVVCTAINQCHMIGTCERSTGLCSSPTAPNGTPCVVDSESGTCRSGRCVVTGNCAPGTYVDSAEGTCVQCPRGSYSVNAGSPSCTVCPDGTSNDGGATSILSCTACAGGTVSVRTSGGIECVPCGSGTFADQLSMTCKGCPAGDYASGSGNARCTSCPPGTYAGGGASQCTPCPAGSFAFGSRNSTCESCGACGQCYACDPTQGCVAQSGVFTSCDSGRGTCGDTCSSGVCVSSGSACECFGGQSQCGSRCCSTGCCSATLLGGVINTYTCVC